MVPSAAIAQLCSSPTATALKLPAGASARPKALYPQQTMESSAAIAQSWNLPTATRLVGARLVWNLWRRWLAVLPRRRAVGLGGRGPRGGDLAVQCRGRGVADPADLLGQWRWAPAVEGVVGCDRTGVEDAYGHGLVGPRGNVVLPAFEGSPAREGCRRSRSHSCGSSQWRRPCMRRLARRVARTRCRPQHARVSSIAIAQLWVAPAETALNSPAGASNCPKSHPQQVSLSSAAIAQLCSESAEMALWGARGSIGRELRVAAPTGDGVVGCDRATVLPTSSDGLELSGRGRQPGPRCCCPSTRPCRRRPWHN